MTTEELAKVGEIISGLGDSASEGLTAYLGFTFAVEVIGYLVGVLVLACLYKLLSPLVSGLCSSIADDYTLKELRRILSAGSPGSIVTQERNEIVRRVQNLIDENKK